VAERTLIEQALAIVEEAQPVGAGDSIPVTPEQALVWTVYLAAQERDRGRGSAEDVAKYVDLARSAGIADAEIDAAFAAAADNP
jgi:hypothetical protein